MATTNDSPGNNALTASGSAVMLSASLGSLTIDKFGGFPKRHRTGAAQGFE